VKRAKSKLWEGLEGGLKKESRSEWEGEEKQGLLLNKNYERGLALEKR